MKIGKYTLAYTDDGLALSVNEECPERQGESMDFSSEKFEKLLDRYWVENF